LKIAHLLTRIWNVLDFSPIAHSITAKGHKLGVIPAPTVQAEEADLNLVSRSASALASAVREEISTDQKSPIQQWRRFARHFLPRDSECEPV
jgi:hypothetical protein